MYVASRPVPVAGPKPRGGRISGTVLALGTVSLLTDVSAEMVTAFLPVYLLYTLQVGYVQFGLLDGLYNGATAILRLVGGYTSDRIGRPKFVALFGYGISAVTKVLFPLVGGSALGIGGVLAVDRAGKGLRTAPRDALISFVTPPAQLGRAFGVHRAMDTVGALLGPLLTFLLLAKLGSSPTPVFVVSFCFALLGLIVLAAFVRERPVPAGRPKLSLRRGLGVLRDRTFRRAWIAASLLGLVTISDAFVFVVLQKVAGVPIGLLPLLPLGTALVFLLAAAPLGALADRVGRWPVFFAGHVLLLLVYCALLLPGGGYPMVGAVLLAHGVFYACTDGVLMAYAGSLVPESARGTGMAVLQTGQAVARLSSSLVFGFLLAGLATGTAVLVLAVAMAVTLAVTGPLVRERAR
ncbi:MFS transporter [Amycolatopsis nigrescens]|uniref:MFS transporter n=1 Tax=Amycolatopsis nigrescens TaxID=381445 RepID=UPI000380DC8C|nr:MFS transporter [Amycolatopsis nigrescens]